MHDTNDLASLRIVDTERTSMPIWAGVSAAVMAVGSLGPWVRTFIINLSGVDGSDGWIVIGCAAVAGMVLYRYYKRRGRIALNLCIVIICGAFGFIVFVVHGVDVFGTQADENGLFGKGDLIRPGWGLIAVGASSLSLIIAAYVLWVKERMVRK